jgi:hypothetical protein
MKIAPVVKGLKDFPVQLLFSYPAIKYDIDNARRENKSVLWAGVKSAVKNNWTYLLVLGTSNPALAMTGVSLLLASPAIISAGIGFTRARNDAIRLTATPFSQRFEHSDWTWREQQRGMSAISGARNMIGSEAGAFARRYSRR